MPKQLLRGVIVLLPLVAMGCTIHPSGEKEERLSAANAQKGFTAHVSPLPDTPTLDDLVKRALITNPAVQQSFWEWKSAIEQIPQDGTQPGNFAFTAGMDVTKGAIGSRASTIGIGNDPMADILLPAKLSLAAKRASQNARAAGMRFRKAQLAVRAKVVWAYVDYALTWELIRLGSLNTQLVDMARGVVEAKNRAGLGAQADLLRITNELELSRNETENLRSSVPGELATLNALLDQAPDATIHVPEGIPDTPQLAVSDDEILRLAGVFNPELVAINDELAAGQGSLRLAKLRYIPDFAMSVNTDLAGITQSLMGMVTLPLFRFQAIDAAVSQAEANLKAKEAMRRQMRNDILAELATDLSAIKDAARQLRVFRDTLIPRARLIVTATRSSYEAGQGSLLDLLDTERSLAALQRLELNLHANNLKRLAMVEALAGTALDSR